ncbi:hypothetical protein pb186bvf_010513 [Paramecium bursaria]
MLYIYILFTSIFAQKITLKKQEYEQEQIIINEDELWYYESFDEFGEIIDYDIKQSFYTEEPICDLYLNEIGYLPIHVNIGLENQITKPLDELSVQELFQDSKQQYVAMAQDENGLLIVTNQGNMSYYEISYNPLTLKLTATQSIQNNPQDTINEPQLIYDSKNQIFFYFQESQAYSFQIIDHQFQKINSIDGLRHVEIQFPITIDSNQSLLYQPAGVEGLIIYTIYGGQVKFQQQLSALSFYGVDKRINIIQVQASESFIYFIDTINGISRLKIENAVANLDPSFQPLAISDADLISLYNNTLLILQSQQRRTDIIEYYVSETQQILMKRFSTKFNAISVFQNDQFALINTQETSFIVPVKFPAQSYIFKPRTFFYQKSIQYLFHYHGDYKYAFQLTSSSLNIYDYDYYQSFLFCNTQQDPGIYEMSVTFNSTNCERRNTSDLLEVCQITKNYGFQIHRPLFAEDERDSLQVLVIIFITFLLMTFICFFISYRRYLVQVEIIKRQSEDKQRSLKKSQINQQKQNL